MANGIMYSANPFLKFQIQEKYIGAHYVWCSEHFDTGILGVYSFGSLIAPSSCPAAIFRQLREDVMKADRHSAKIAQQKASISARAVAWALDGRISDDQRDEILFMVNNADFQQWRPLVYAIPIGVLGGRKKLVPIAQRAGFGEEYVVEDLTRAEFDLIEL